MYDINRTDDVIQKVQAAVRERHERRSPKTNYDDILRRNFYRISRRDAAIAENEIIYSKLRLLKKNAPDDVEAFFALVDQLQPVKYHSDYELEDYIREHSEDCEIPQSYIDAVDSDHRCEYEVAKELCGFKKLCVG